jgi:predicted HTH domain antitoxin
MTVEVGDECLRGLRVTPDRFRLEAAVGLYASEEATLGQAAGIAGISQTELLHELGRRGICFHYDASDLDEDLHTLERLGRLPRP